MRSHYSSGYSHLGTISGCLPRNTTRLPSGSSEISRRLSHTPRSSIPRRTFPNSKPLPQCVAAAGDEHGEPAQVQFDPLVPEPVRQRLLCRHQARTRQRGGPPIARPSRCRPAIWARRSRSGCATTAPASPAKSGTDCFSRSKRDQADRRRDGSRALDQLGHRHATTWRQRIRRIH